MIIQEKEYESKVFISQKTFHSLLKKQNLSLVDNSLIKNNYFDTPLFDIFENNGVFRVREVKGKYTQTFKRALAKNALIEHNKKIKEEDFTKLKSKKIKRSKFKTLIEDFGVDYNQVQFLGYLITHRWEIPFDKSTIFIDHCFYNGKEDWEIECESSSAKKAEEQLVKFCKENKISFSNKTQSKYGRFLKTIRGGR